MSRFPSYKADWNVKTSSEPTSPGPGAIILFERLVGYGKLEVAYLKRLADLHDEAEAGRIRLQEYFDRRQMEQETYEVECSDRAKVKLDWHDIPSGPPVAPYPGAVYCDVPTGEYVYFEDGEWKRCSKRKFWHE